MADHTDYNVNPSAEPLSSGFNDATAQYQIFARSIDIDLHLGRMVSDEFDKGLETTFWGNGIGSAANHEYIEIMSPDGMVDSRIEGVGLDANWKMTPNDRLIGFVHGSEARPLTESHIFQADPHPDQQKYPGQVQDIDDPDENMLIATVSEGQMLQIKLALTNATIQINEDNPGFGLLGASDPNSNSFANTMREVIKETVSLMPGGDANIDFDPDGWSPGAGQRIPTQSVELFEGTIAELKAEITSRQAVLDGQLTALESNIDTDLKSAPEQESGREGVENTSGGW